MYLYIKIKIQLCIYILPYMICELYIIYVRFPGSKNIQEYVMRDMKWLNINGNFEVSTSNIQSVTFICLL